MYLPWNNPVVGTAFLLRARRGNLLLNVSLYIVMLVMGMAGWQYYVAFQPKQVGNPHNLFLVILYSVQCFISGLIILGQAGGAIKNEVMNKTLDFQRIAALGPWDFLLGKLLGVPVMAYLLAIASIPIGVFTLMNGVQGVSLLALFLSWLQMLTFLFLLGSISIQNTLQMVGAKGTGGSPGFAFFMVLLGLLAYATFGPGDCQSFLSDPRRSSLNALFTPFTAYAGMSIGDPWYATFSWFGIEIPCLLFTPVAHLVCAGFILSIMARRLQLIDNTPMGKRLAYWFIFLCDLVLAGALYGCSSQGKLSAAGLSLDALVGFYLVGHVLLTFVYFVMLTPSGEFIQTWIWRFRTPGGYFRDSLLLDRAPNTLAVLVNLLSAGFGVMLLCVTLGVGFTFPNFLFDVTLTAGVSIVFLGLFYQALQCFTRKHAGSIYLLVLLLFIVGPTMAGSLLSKLFAQEYQTLGKVLLHMTPLTQLFRYSGQQSGDLFLQHITPYPMAAGYALLSFLLWLYTWRWLKRKTLRIDETRARLLATSPVPSLA